VNAFTEAGDDLRICTLGKAKTDNEGFLANILYGIDQIFGKLNVQVLFDKGGVAIKIIVQILDFLGRDFNDEGVVRRAGISVEYGMWHASAPAAEIAGALYAGNSPLKRGGR